MSKPLSPQSQTTQGGKLSGFDKLGEVICPVLQLEEENRTFVKIEGGKTDFFSFKLDGADVKKTHRDVVPLKLLTERQQRFVFFFRKPVSRNVGKKIQAQFRYFAKKICDGILLI